MNIKAAIEEGLRKKGMTLTQLAKSLNVTTQAIYDMYKANDTRISRILELSKVLDMPLSSFIGDAAIHVGNQNGSGENTGPA